AALSPLRHHPFDVVVLDLALVGNRSLDLVDEPAIVEGESWLVLVGEPPSPARYPRRLLARAAHELLPRDERLVESLAGLLRFARRAVAVRARASRYQNLFRHSADGILLFDTRGVVLDANPRALDQLGYAREELLGMRFDALYPAEERRRVLAALQGIADAGGNGYAPPGGATVSLEVPVLRRDGAAFPAEVSMAAFHGGGQELVQAVVRDLSPRRALEQRLQEVQRKEALGRLAGGVAHDLNNLLTVIQGYGALLAEHVPAAGEARRFLDEVTAAGERASSLTHQLLAFSRRQVLRPKLVDVNEELSRLQRLLHRTLGEDVRLVVELARELPRVRIDPAQLEQVIVNLAVNARDAMPRGGTLTLATELVAAPRTEAGGAEPLAEWVRLRARDTGVGMSEEVLAHLFEPFFTTKERGKGTGLGLASVYGAVRQSGGEVRVRSALGAGTTFDVLLPPAADDAAALHDTGSHAAMTRPLSSGAERVLVVEDDDAVRRLVVEVLRGAGYAVEEAADGEDALALAASLVGTLDLLLCDIVLPDRSGVEVAAGIAELRPAVRTLFMSGHAPRAIARQGKLRPGSRFIAKPFTPEGLLEKVARVLVRPA
ncbi:MAG TPA: ATP-binding protein, partial [Thermoanaerobaculia bacterium]|nr:ATP-binding protein [Thermoanaerobaculia bacterium]